MRRTTFGWQLVSALALGLPLVVPAAGLRAQGASVANAATAPWTAQELDNLLAPVALYPDPILAQVLVAATYPEQVLAAQAHVKAFGSDGIDQMPWEISVKAVARYEPVLNLLADGEDWMTALGQAYATQAPDVMDAVQRLRRMASAQGNLQTSAQQQVVVEREVIRIVPAEPRVIYVPTYDPEVIYHRPVYVTHAHPAYWSWGVAWPVGVWLTYDVDWWGHRVYYHGWHDHGPRWVVVARPWIVVNPIYIAPRHRIIVVNRGVVHRRWDTRYVRRYGVVHRNAGFERHDRGYRRDGGKPGVGSRSVAERRAMPRDGSYGERVVPPRAPAPRATAPSATSKRADSQRPTGTWTSRPARERAVPAPQASAPRNRSESTPRANAPRSRSESAPRASTPRASAPRASAPRASEPRSSGGSKARSGQSSGERSSRGSAREKPRGN